MKSTNAYRATPRRHVTPIPPAPDYDRIIENSRANLIDALRDDGSDFGRQLLRELESER